MNVSITTAKNGWIVECIYSADESENGEAYIDIHLYTYEATSSDTEKINQNKAFVNMAWDLHELLGVSSFSKHDKGKLIMEVKKL